MNYLEFIHAFNESPKYNFIIDLMHPGLDTEKDDVITRKIIHTIIEYEIEYCRENKIQSSILAVCEAYLLYRTEKNLDASSITCNKTGIMSQICVCSKVKLLTCLDLIEYLDGNRNFSTFMKETRKVEIGIGIGNMYRPAILTR